MKKALSILMVVSLMFIALGSGMALPEESREEVQVRVLAFVDEELEELVGLWVKVWYAEAYSSYDELYCKGKVLGRKGSNWLIIRDMKDFITWCYIPTIRKIMILSEDYIPKFD